MTIDESFCELRDAINHSVVRRTVWEKKYRSWGRLWAAMDALEDSQVAIDSFKGSERVQYLELYGLLQAFYIQQDAIDHIAQVTIEAGKIRWSKDQPTLNSVRDLRNHTVGHPADAKYGGLFTNIDRHSISNASFQYIGWSRTGAEIHNVKLDEIISTQEKELIKIIEGIMDSIQEIDHKFNNKFKDERLMDKYSQVIGYTFEKIRSISGDRTMNKSMFGSLANIYREVRKGLHERYGDFEFQQGLKYTVERLDEIIERMQSMIDNDIPDEFNYAVYEDVLESEWKEFGDTINEADDKFSHVGKTESDRTPSTEVKDEKK